MDRYRYTGISLAAVGGALALSGYYIMLSVQLTAIGLGFLLVGILVFLVSQPPGTGTPEYEHIKSRSIFKLFNAFVEELNINMNPIFIGSGEGPIVLYPLTDVDNDSLTSDIPDRLLVNMGESYYLKIRVVDGDVFPDLPGETSLDGIESYLTSQLISRFDIMRKVRVVEDPESRIIVEVEGLDRRYVDDLSNYGYLTLCIGSIIGEGIKESIRLTEVERSRNRYRLIFRRL